MRFLIALYLITSPIWAAIKATNDPMTFEISGNSNMELSGNTLTLDSIDLKGNISTAPVIISDNATLSTKSLVLANSSSGNIILTLPNTKNGKRYYIKKMSHLNKVILYGGGNNIDNVTSITLDSSSGNTYPSISVFSDDKQWYVENIKGQVSYPSSINSDITLPSDGHYAHIDTSSNNVILRLDRATVGSGDHIFSKTPDSYTAYIGGEGNTINGSALMEITGSDPVILSRDGHSWSSSSSSLSLPFGDNLIAYFPFNETTSGANLNDLTKHKHVMEPASTTAHTLSVNGIVGSGHLRTINGAKAYVAKNPFSQDSIQWSINFWFKIKEPHDKNSYEFIKNYNSNDSAQRGHCRVTYSWSDHKVKAVFLSGSGNVSVDGESPSQDEWNHVVITNGSKLKLYLNGELKGNNSKGSHGNPSMHKIRLFDNGVGDAEMYFDELYFINRELTTDEIRLLYEVH